MSVFLNWKDEDGFNNCRIKLNRYHESANSFLKELLPCKRACL
jgi:hypothetical protein